MKIGRKLEDQGDEVDKVFLLTDLTFLKLCCFFLGLYEEVEDLYGFELRVDPSSSISWTGASPVPGASGTSARR